MTIKSLTRSAVDRWAPRVGTACRILRDSRRASAPGVPTPFGITLAGNVSMAEGTFERNEIEVFLDQLRDVSTLVDVGANIGFYTCLASHHGKHVIAVEPMARNLHTLYRNLNSNNFLKTEVYALGLSDEPGISRLFGSGTGASFLPGWAGGSAECQSVPVSTLDLIVNTRFDGQRIFIKIDVEGFEYPLLLGASRTLSLRPKPVWLVEICLDQHFPGGQNPKFRETFEIFWRAGYQAHVADMGQRAVEPEDVDRWVAQGFADFGSHNYLFR